MTINDVERAIVNAGALLHELAQRSQVALRGLDEAQRGTLRVHAQDDHRPVNDPKGPAVVPIPDEAARDLRGCEHDAKSLLNAAHSLFDRLTRYHRLGLDLCRDDAGRIIAPHPDRWATPDERKIADAQDLDEDSCRSCIRVGHFAFAKTDHLCGSCLELLTNCRAVAPTSKITLPPEVLVRYRSEGKRIYDVDYRAAMAPAAKKRRAKA